MHEQRHQIAQYLAARGRVTRYSIPTAIPAGERVAQVEHLVNTLWPLAASLGIDLGKKPTIIYSCAPLAAPSAILGLTAVHLVETLAVFNMTGLAMSATSAIRRVSEAPISAPHPYLTDLLDDSSDDQDAIHTT